MAKKKIKQSEKKLKKAKIIAKKKKKKHQEGQAEDISHYVHQNY